MKPGTKRALTLSAWTLLFFVGGFLLYKSLYALVLKLLKLFTKGGVMFQGELPMFFIRILVFGFVFCVIPCCIFICHQILKGRAVKDYIWTCILYIIFFITSFWALCDFESFFIVASSDPMKRNQVLFHNVQDIHLNTIFILAIVVATILTSIANMIKWLRAPKPKPKTKPRQNSGSGLIARQ